MPTSGKYSKDNKAFVFSLDRKEKYKINTSQCCTQYVSGNYFEFGGPNIVIQQNCQLIKWILSLLVIMMFLPIMLLMGENQNL